MTKKLQITRRADESEEQAKARAALTPEHTSTAVLSEFGVMNGASIGDMAHELKRLTAAINSGDVRRAESILAAQAHTLDGLFANLALRANASASLDQFDSYLRLALKAQSQCRATLQTLGELKAPRQVAFVKQANIGNNVQVNNESAAPLVRARKTKKTQSELLEVENGEWLDTRAQSTPSGFNSHAQTVAKEHRPAQRRRKSNIE